MSKKLLDTFVRISKSTRAKLNAHCHRNDLQQGRFVDTAILNQISAFDALDMGNPNSGIPTNGRKAAPKPRLVKAKKTAERP